MMIKLNPMKISIVVLVTFFVTKLFFEIPSLGILLFLPIICIAYFLWKPIHSGIFIAILSSGLIPYNKLPKLPVLGGSLYLTDAIVIALLGVIILKSTTDYGHIPSFKTSVLLRPISFLGLLVFFSCVKSFLLLEDVGAHFVLRDLRPLLYFFTMYFVLRNTIKSETDYKNTLNAFVVIAVLVGIAQVIEAKLVLGFTAAWIREAELEGGVKLEGINRVSLPGLSFLLFSSLYLTKSLLHSTNKWKIKLLSLLICLMGILSSFGRMRFFSLLVGFIFLFILLNRREKSKYFLLLTSIACLLILSSFMLSHVGSESIRKRLQSVFEQRTYYGESLNWRFRENQDAINTIRQNPLFGIGMGKDYRGAGLMRSGFSGAFSYIHNGYFFILIKIGFIGLVSFLWIILCFLKNSIYNIRKVKGFDLDVNIASMLTMICLGIASFTQSEISNFSTMTLVALLLFISEPVKQLT